MKISVFGNSNALLSDGWLMFFKEELSEASVHNFSVGGSPSPALLYQMLSRSDQLAGSDAVVIEPTVVDHGNDWQSPAKISTFAAATLEQALSVGATVFLLVLPRKADFIPEPSPGMIAWSAAARRLGVQVLDIRPELVALAEEFSCEAHELWRDNAGHLIHQAQKMVGKLVAEAVRSSGSLNGDRTSIQDYQCGYRVIGGGEIAAVAGISPLTRSTSVMSVDVAALNEQQEISLNMASDEAIHGFMVNYGVLDHTKPAFLEVSTAGGSDPKKVNLANSFLTAKPSRNLVAMFRSISMPVGFDRLEFVGSGDGSGANNVLEICGILVGPALVPNSDWKTGGIGAFEAVDTASGSRP